MVRKNYIVHAMDRDDLAELCHTLFTTISFITMDTKYYPKLLLKIMTRLILNGLIFY